jgi:NADH-quinone oxidoreductase subunit J
MSFSEWIGDPLNWVFLVLALAVLVSGLRVVTSPNVVHAALFLVATLAATAGFFLLLSAEFVAWVLVLVYIGAVIVLFLFGIMITRAPTGRDTAVDHPRRLPSALIALALFGVLAWSSWSAFGAAPIEAVGEGSSTEVLGEALLGRFLIPFEIVSFLLLAALVGGITLARKDQSPAEEEAALVGSEG